MSVAVDNDRGVRAPSRRATTRQPRTFDRPRLLWVITVLALAFLFLPVAVVGLFSLNSSSSLVLFGGGSLRWYRGLADSPDILSSFRFSLEIAAAAAACSTAVGTLLAFGLVRGARRPAGVLGGVVLLQLVSPETATGVALLLLFTQLGIHLSAATLLVSHVVLSISLVTVVVRSRLASIHAEVEDAAMDLGAGRLAAVRLTVLPLLWPTILSAGMVAFVLSFDDFVTSFFTSGIGTPPLPVRIYSMIRFGVTPVVNAVGILMMGITLLAVAAALLLARISNRRPGGTP